jgi:hypothetical protein
MLAFVVEAADWIGARLAAGLAVPHERREMVGGYARRAIGSE